LFYPEEMTSFAESISDAIVFFTHLSRSSRRDLVSLSLQFLELTVDSSSRPLKTGQSYS